MPQPPVQASTSGRDAGKGDALLADLTSEQQAAVKATEGPVLILAGAGSGKTRVLTRRIAYLVRMGVEPASILAITFTNKAAGEMRGRVDELLGRRIRDFGRLFHQSPTICTFHSLCLRILRQYGDTLGVPRNFHIFDTADQTRLMKQVLKELDISSTNFPPGNVLGTISNAKNALTTAQQFAAVATDFFQRTVARAYLKYEEELARNEALDFDDLILRVVYGLRDHPDVLAELQRHFQYLHIDEYQDTNRAQYMLAHVLAASHHNICVVGDPDQSIYAWRGADIRNILDFETDYPSATVVRLERNYRSTAKILAIADALIARNTQRKEKKLVPVLAAGEDATLIICQDEHDEAREIAALLQKLKHDDGYDFSDMAIFYRVNALTRVIEDALRREKIPYQIARGVEFYNRKEIKDALAYLRVIANPADEVSLARIINLPTRGISDPSVRSLQGFGTARGMNLWRAMHQASECESLTARARTAVVGFLQALRQWRQMAGIVEAHTQAGAQSDETPPPELGFSPAAAHAPGVRELLETVMRQSGLEAYLRKLGGEERDELANVNELISSAAEFDEQNPEGTLSEFLHGVALVSDVDHLKGSGGAVTLMTLHAAKGLEFPVVAIIGWEEGCLPHARARTSLDELEEERRLAFVGITRAQERLIVSRAVYRTIRGMRERTIPSPFLKELPEERIQVIDRTSIADLLRGGSGSVGELRRWQRQDMDDRGDHLAGRFHAGQRVRHENFGAGKVLEVVGGTHAKLVINFDRVGQKTLILEYAASKLMPL